MGKPDDAPSSSHNNWSEPLWSEIYQQWYTERIGRNGQTEYQWIGEVLPAAAVQDDAIPRSQPHVDHITQRVRGMNIGQAGCGGQQYTHESQQGGGNYGAVDPSQSHLPADSIGASDSSSSSIYTHSGVVERDPSIGEGKGKARADHQQHMNSGVALMQGDTQPIDPGFGLSGGGYGGGGATNMTGSATYSPYPEQFGGPYGTVEGDALVEGGFDQAVTESRSLNFRLACPGEASSYNVEPTIDPNTYSYAEDEEEDEGTITPRGNSSSGSSLNRPIDTNPESPISTYEGKACTKNGVRASKHGIVYELSRHKKPPRLLKKEPKLGFEPVALEIYAHNEKLQFESRVNYSKLVTIEHNVKVFFIGRVVQQHLDYVQNAVNECWALYCWFAGYMRFTNDNSTPGQQAG
ncbi:hypothetical protein DL769_010025 [Monosporascus sp. CRB-8-3]|nr:hypothetical protein DL769_010025 [Monosporascus sp. CRB-8-3]